MRLTDIDKARIRKLKGQNWTHVKIAAEIGCSESAISHTLSPERGREYYATHSEQIRKNVAAYKAANLDKIHDYDRMTLRRVRQLANRYHHDWRAMYMVRALVQGGLCFLCDQPEHVSTAISGKVKRLALDHDHSCCPGQTTCGRCVRLYLCRSCNRRIGDHETRGKPINDRDLAYLIGCKFYLDQGKLLPIWQRAYEAIANGERRRATSKAAA